MRRGLVLGVLLGMGTLSVAVAGLQQAPNVITVEKLRDNLYVLRGGGGNTAVFIASDGVTIVDTKNPGWGQTILDEVKKLTDRPVRTIINTHAHADHVSGNVDFPRGTDIVTQEKNEAAMKTMAIFKGLDGKGMPTRMYGQAASLSLDDDQIDLYYFGRGHTDGDTWVVFPTLGVMHAGDMFSGKTLPLLDNANGGSGIAIPDSLRKAAMTLGGIDQIITGHGAVMTHADLEEYAEFNREFMQFVDAGKLKGQTVDQIVASWKMPANYKRYAQPAPARLRSNVELIFNELP